MKGTLTTWANMQIYEGLAVNDQHEFNQASVTTNVSYAITLLLELDELLWWYDRHVSKLPLE